MNTIRHFYAMVTALLAALLLGMGTADAQTISNTANAQWTVQGTPFTTQSNTVTLAVTQIPATILTYTPSTGGPASLAYTPALCGGQQIALPGGLGASGTAAPLEQTSSLRIGDVLFVRLSAPQANLNPAAVDSVTMTLTSTAGDSEQLQVFETSVNSGLFVGAITTVGAPPQPSQGDCRLGVASNGQISVRVTQGSNVTAIATSLVNVLADPFGLTFDSEDGSPVSGVQVSLVDAATGAPATVYADDGVTRWPSTLISGQPVTDSAGNSYPMQPGEYRFPLAPLGSYRLVVSPPSPYSAPSAASPAQLAGLTRPDGGPLQIVPASFGGALALTSPSPVRVDIPLDRPASTVSLAKTASRFNALPGDVVFYTVTLRNADPLRAKTGVRLVDTPSSLLRLRADSVRVDGAPNAAAVQIAPDGRSLTVLLGDVAPGATRTVTYAMTVRPDAPAGQALNRAVATDSRGLTSTASAAVRIERNDIAARMTLIGRITDGGCAVGAEHRGIPGVRLILEDGSFAITDAEGRYHFDGLVPGSHVVQALGNTLPQGGQFSDCTRSTRSAGSASSRFIMGQGGSLVAADFSAILPEGSLSKYENTNINSAEAAPAPRGRAAATDDAQTASDRAAAGAEIDWLARGDGPTDFLFPALDHNPRAPAVRVVIRHRAGQKVELKVDGKPVDPLSYDGQRAAPGGTYAVSIWRGIPLEGDDTRLTAVVRKADGTVDTELARTVHFAAAPAKVELLLDRSTLVADGVNRPVLALRLLDRNGRPVHAGVTGSVSINAPYESAAALDAMQSRALAGLGRDAPRWIVKGDDGVALVELAPTMVSGKVRMEFAFATDTSGRQQRRQELEAWIVPGDQPWTLVGLAEGSIGSKSVADAMERSGRFDSDLGNHARVAFYAKGRILGKFLLTAAYDSAKQRDDQRLAGAIDPRAYYTVFADGSDRRHDAASREKLYVRIEGKTFYAMFGDIETGFDQTQLARYQRSATGLKAEVNTGGLHAQAFAARIAASHRRDEIQGGGLTGPYRLSSRAIIANSEQVSIEVRDRFRSEVIVSRRSLTRFIDYDIDMLAGTITFKEPVLSRDADLNPQFIVIDYEVGEDVRGGDINAGLRASYTTSDGRLRIGASAVTDTGSGDGKRTNLGGVDLRARLGQSTEIRAEAAVSETDGAHSKAWTVEAEHHTGALDLLAYARSADEHFGVGQLNGAEQGRRKVGVDARVAINPDLSVATSSWIDDSLTDGSRRIAIQASALYHSKNTDVRVGIAHFDDRLADGRTTNSTMLEGAVTQHLLDNRLEVSAATSIALDQGESIDLPERHRLTARFAISPDVKLVGSYEIANGANISARTARAGVEVQPWAGGRMVGTLGQQDISELGKRSFAAFGLAQSLNVSQYLTLDATLDSNRTLSGFDAGLLVNPEHPAASGGNLGENGSIAEDFTAVTLGATYRRDRWSSTLRGEWRDGQLADRKGVTFGAIRQLGEGSMVGSGFTWTRATAAAGGSSEIFDGAVAAAHRPATSPFAFLAKVEYRADAVRNAVAGEAGAAGRGAMLVTGDATARRLIGSVSTNWSPQGHDPDRQLYQRTEIGLFGAVRHTFDAFEGYDLKGTTLLGGLDARIGLGDRLEVGGVATVRWSMTDHTTNFAFGPQIGVTPTKNVLLTLGYNVIGFRDRDFSAARSTDEGVFATLRMKLDNDTLGFLGLRR